MQAPTVSTNQNEATLAANNKQEMADSAISKTPVSPQVAISTITTTDKTSLNEKEQRLADYVSKMDELRKTTGPEGFRLQQTLKAKNIIASLLGDSDKVLYN